MSLVEKVQGYLQVVNTDFEASLEYLSDDIVWINKLPEHVPFGGEYKGKKEVVSYFGELAASFVIGTYPLEEFDFIETDNTLVMVGYEKDAKVLFNSKIFDLSFVWVIKFNSDGKICYLREHNDTAAIGDAFLPVEKSVVSAS